MFVIMLNGYLDVCEYVARVFRWLWLCCTGI